MRVYIRKNKLHPETSPYHQIVEGRLFIVPNEYVTAETYHKIRQ